MEDGENRLKRYYKNKESRDIEKFLNNARKKLNEESGFEVIKYPAEVWFFEAEKEWRWKLGKKHFTNIVQPVKK